ncbi:MAG: diguanylate cyclase [Defluviitaleaceae bacterium]|nr:diguanylate cyclase [Defluviitaleaceae bacterium]MCL2239553.1 diguanylate cyclase [Defluviitaleaceae bacterium]
MDKQKDPLTGFFVGAGLNPDIDALVAKDTPFALVALDIDNLLTINHDFGMEAGDWVFRLIARHVDALFPAPSTAYRAGADNFAILMPGKNKETAFLIAEELRRCIHAEKGESLPGQSISVGISAYPEDGSRAADIYRRADSAMVRAKKEGRNCVRLAREEKLTPKTSHYTAAQLEQLSEISEKISVGEAALLREALDDLLRKYDS